MYAAGTTISRTSLRRQKMYAGTTISRTSTEAMSKRRFISGDVTAVYLLSGLGCVRKMARKLIELLTDEEEKKEGKVARPMRYKKN